MTETPRAWPSPAATPSASSPSPGDPAPPAPADGVSEGEPIDLARPPVLRRFTGWVLLHLGLSACVGVLAGVLWWRVVSLPVYVVGSDGRASTSERGLTEYFAADAWFCLIGLVVGIGLGILAWRWLSTVGWPVVPVAVLGTLLAALLCWYVGWSLGPGPFDPRLASAEVGAEVPIELTVRTWVSAVVWVFGASIPLLLLSALTPDHEEPKPLRRSRVRRRREG